MFLQIPPEVTPKNFSEKRIIFKSIHKNDFYMLHEKDFKSNLNCFHRNMKNISKEYIFLVTGNINKYRRMEEWLCKTTKNGSRITPLQGLH